jgi:hypothetical protein
MVGSGIEGWQMWVIDWRDWRESHGISPFIYVSSPIASPYVPLCDSRVKKYKDLENLPPKYKGQNVIAADVNGSPKRADFLDFPSLSALYIPEL